MGPGTIFYGTIFYKNNKKIESFFDKRKTE